MPVADLIESFDLNRLPDGFYDNPFERVSKTTYPMRRHIST